MKHTAHWRQSLTKYGPEVDTPKQAFDILGDTSKQIYQPLVVDDTSKQFHNPGEGIEVAGYPETGVEVEKNGQG